MRCLPGWPGDHTSIFFPGTGTVVHCPSGIARLSEGSVTLGRSDALYRLPPPLDAKRSLWPVTCSPSRHAIAVLQVEANGSLEIAGYGPDFRSNPDEEDVALASTESGQQLASLMTLGPNGVAVSLRFIDIACHRLG